MKHRAAALFRLAGILLASWVLPSCGSGGSGSPPPTPLPRLLGTSTYLFDVDATTGACTKRSGLGLAGFLNIRGLAFNPAGTQLYLYSRPTSELLRIASPFTGAPEAIGGIPGYADLNGMVYDAPRNRLLMIDTNSNKLVAVDPDTALPSLVGTLTPSPPTCLAFDPGTGTLYGCTLTHLFTINPTTAATTQIAAFSGGSTISAIEIDPGTGTLYGSDTAGGGLVTINKATAAVTPVGPSGLPSTDVILDFATHPATGTLYAIPSLSLRLCTINKATGAATPGQILGFSSLRGLAWNPAIQKYYAVDVNKQSLMIVDPLAAQATLVGSVNPGNISGLAYDAVNAILYGVNISTNNLVTLNTTTGAPAVVGAIGFTQVHGLAFNGSPGTLFATGLDKLLTINTATGAGTLVGSLSPDNVYALAWDATTNTLYGADYAFPRLVTINTTTAAVTPVGPINLSANPQFTGFYWHPPTHRLLGYLEASLWEFNASTGAATSIHSMGSHASGLAYNPDDGILYGADASFLFTVDPSTGATCRIGALGYGFVLALTYDTNSKTLFGYESQLNRLLSINRTTGAATVVGGAPAGLPFLYGLAFDAGTNTLYGTSGLNTTLWAINPQTGVTTAAATLTMGGILGLEFDPGSGMLYGTIPYERKLVRIDPQTGVVTVVGTLSHFMDGLTIR